VLVTDPGTVIGIGAPQVLFAVVRVTPVIVLVVGLVFHVGIGEHWFLVIRFEKATENYGISVIDLRARVLGGNTSSCFWEIIGQVTLIYLASEQI
jgi:hypothetical protein